MDELEQLVAVVEREREAVARSLSKLATCERASRAYTRKRCPVDSTTSLLTDGLRGAAALAAVLGLLLLLAWSLRRAGVIRPPAGAGRLAVTGSLPLDSRNRLLLVRCDGREHLLALGPAGVRVIESQAAIIPAPAPLPPERA